MKLVITTANGMTPPRRLIARKDCVMDDEQQIILICYNCKRKETNGIFYHGIDFGTGKEFYLCEGCHDDMCSIVNEILTDIQDKKDETP